MKITLTFLSIFVLLLVGGAVGSTAQAEASSPCKTLDLRHVPQGTRCLTSKGFIFQLVIRTSEGKEVWKDETSQLTWSDRLASVYNWQDAMRFCQTSESFEARGRLSDLLFYLPSENEFDTAESHGFREVLPGLGPYWFWSRTIHDNIHHDYPLFFDGRDGYMGVDFWDHYNSVMCIARG